MLSKHAANHMQGSSDTRIREDAVHFDDGNNAAHLRELDAPHLTDKRWSVRLTSGLPTSALGAAKVLWPPQRPLHRGYA